LVSEHANADHSARRLLEVLEADRRAAAAQDP
jgi:hypothetical protein